MRAFLSNMPTWSGLQKLKQPVLLCRMFHLSTKLRNFQKNWRKMIWQIQEMIWLLQMYWWVLWVEGNYGWWLMILRMTNKTMKHNQVCLLVLSFFIRKNFNLNLKKILIVSFNLNKTDRILWLSHLFLFFSLIWIKQIHMHLLSFVPFRMFFFLLLKTSDNKDHFQIFRTWSNLYLKYFKGLNWIFLIFI